MSNSDPHLNLDFIPAIADLDLHCFRCVSIGIPTPTILRNHSFILVVIGGTPVDFCCCDCFERMRDDIRIAEPEIDSGFDCE